VGNRLRDLFGQLIQSEVCESRKHDLLNLASLPRM
jgi:hypothetical protein